MDEPTTDDIIHTAWILNRVCGLSQAGIKRLIKILPTFLLDMQVGSGARPDATGEPCPPAIPQQERER